MGKECIIAIDQGTTGSRVYIYDKKAKILASEYQESRQYFPKASWVEHDPEEIWESVHNLLTKTLKKSRCKVSHVQGIGITNQRETIVVWDRKTGKPIYNAIVWQCRRTADLCAALKKDPAKEEMVRQKTGLLIDSYFSATKIQWILDNIEGAREKAEKGELATGTMDTWLLYKLTGEHATDYTNASRTLLYNIETKNWDADLLDLFRVPETILPNVYPSRHHYGTILAIPELGGAPILAMIGDQQASLYGQLCVKPGQAKNTYGTGAFLLMNTGNKFMISKAGLISTLACNAEGSVVYALEGSVFIAGAVMQWLRDSLQFFKKASDSEKLIQGIEGQKDEVIFVPAFAGLGAPHWDMQARGGILGLSRDTSIAQIVRGALKSMALQSYELVNTMEKESQESLDTLRVDGGATSNKYLMQYQADILRKPVERPKNLDTTALGSAYLAGLEGGFWTFSDLQSFSKEGKRFEPQMSEAEITRELRYWNKGVSRVRDWSEIS